MATVGRRTVATILAAVAIMLAFPLTASADKPGYTCPPAFDLGPLTVEASAQLPNIVNGIADGIYTYEDHVAKFDFVNHNGDDVICFQEFPSNANPASLLQYFYNVVDNNASVPGS